MTPQEKYLDSKELFIVCPSANLKARRIEKLGDKSTKDPRFVYLKLKS
jgi:hypothetical protein